jgi:hypothetical protein
VEIFKLALNNFFCAKAGARSESFGPRHAPDGYATTSPAFCQIGPRLDLVIIG